MSRSRTRPTGIVICRWRSRPRTGRAPRCGLRGALDLADHLIERGRTAHASTLVAGVARHFDPHSRAHDVALAARAEFRAGRAAAAVPHACAPRRRRRGAAGHSDARVPGSRATARSRHRADACDAAVFRSTMRRSRGARVRVRTGGPTVLRATEPARAADLVVFNGKIATQDEQRSFVSALAVKDGRIVATGGDRDVLRHAHGDTTCIDLNGRTVIPGLVDAHLQAIRGGTHFNLELRWDGVPSLAAALDLLHRQAARTPAPHWVRVGGGWTALQFAEKRGPTVAELNAIAPDTPVFVRHLGDSAWLNAAALRDRLRARHARSAGRRIAARPPWAADRAAARAPGSGRAGRGARARAGARRGRPDQLDAAVHARAEPRRRDERDRRRRRRSCVSGRLRGGHRACTPRRTDDAHRVRAGRTARRPGNRRLRAVDRADLARRRRCVPARERRRRAAAVFGGRPGEFSRPAHRAARVGRCGTGRHRPAAGPPPLAVPAACDLRRIDRPLPRRVRGGEPRDAVRRAALVFRPVRDDVGCEHRARGGAGRRRDRAAAHGVPGRSVHRARRCGRGDARTADPRDARGRAAGRGRLRRAGCGSYNPFVALYWMVSGRSVGGTVLYPARNRLGRMEALRRYTVGSAWFSAEEHRKGRWCPAVTRTSRC